MLIAGLDVSKADVVVCLIDTDQPLPDPRELYLTGKFPRLTTTAAGLKALLELKPDVCVLEPTGTNYSKFWCYKLNQAGVKLLLVSHSKVRRYRECILSEDKDDEGDSLALAYYGVQNFKNDGAFLRRRDDVAQQMREKCHQLDHLNRIQSPIINRLKQDLAWQFPEEAKKGVDAILFWRWLAGEAKSKRYDNALANTCGLGLTESTREHARLLVQLFPRQQKLTTELRELLKDKRFRPYRKVFAKYGFGEKLEAILISHIYPLSNFLGEDGQPIAPCTRSKKDPKKETVKHLSLRRFQKTLGCSPTREWSGKKNKGSKQAKLAGSAQCRLGLWQWLFTRIEPKRTRIKSLPKVAWLVSETLIQGDLIEYWQYQKETQPIKLARSRTIAKVTKLLFYDLVAELSLDSKK